jgi:release factor glutamine methyltransferase
VTTAYHTLPAATREVYPAQDDSYLLIETMQARGVRDVRVADLCTGSGVVAVAAAAAGAAEVTAFDLCPAAVARARADAAAAAASVDVHLGSWTRAAEFGRFDLVTCNPPYVPHPADDDGVPIDVGPPQAFNAGVDGRLVLDPLCAYGPGLLATGGTLLIVHSEFADVGATVATLRAHGLRTRVAARRQIPFGPVLTARAAWLEATGRLDVGRRVETLCVVEAVRP